MGRRPGRTARRPDRYRPDGRALEGHPVPARRLCRPGRDRDHPPDHHPGRHPHQGAVHPVPQEAGQEDGVHRRPAQAARLRMRKKLAVTTVDTAPAIVPTFDDDTTSGRKLAIICSKGNLDMAYPGLVLANAALGEGVETHLFFTFWGFDMITKSRMNHLQFSPAGNAAMHLPGSDAHFPQALAPLPGVTPAATHMLKKQIADLGVPEVPEFLDQIVAAGGHLWP